MKYLGRAAAAACICALCLLLCSCLVQQSEAPREETKLPAAAGLLMQRCVMPMESAAFFSERSAPEKYDAAAEGSERIQLPHTAQCCDGNGWIITGRTWPRTVYAVCPPEGMPG